MRPPLSLPLATRLPAEEVPLADPLRVMRFTFWRSAFATANWAAPVTPIRAAATLPAIGPISLYAFMMEVAVFEMI